MEENTPLSDISESNELQETVHSLNLSSNNVEIKKRKPILTKKEKYLSLSVLLSLFFFVAQVSFGESLLGYGKILSPLGNENVKSSVLSEATPSAQLEESSPTALVENNTTPALKIVVPNTEVENNSKDSSPTPTNTPPTTPAVANTYSASVGKINFPNNKFGIYSFDNVEHLELAAQLVNSNGGDWGWVLIPIDMGSRDSGHWNSIFQKMKEKHLIPVLQVSNGHKVPTEDDINGLADFLYGLGWPTKIRPISFFNEVNAGEYWGGNVDPEGYARILSHAADKLHGLSSEFIVMNGAFNGSAHTLCTKTDLGVNTCYISLDEYMRRMNNAVPGIFKKIDAWASHAYPHPGYRGTPSDRAPGYDNGRLTIRVYKWELGLLASYGVSLPVFITEGGWPHSEGKTTHPEWLSAATVASYYAQAFNNVWLPDRAVVAVMPFMLRRDDFDNFAFVGADGSRFPQWDAVAGIPKIAGQPPIN